MNEQRLSGMMGLALRARQAVTGTDACSMMIEAGKCGVLLLDENAGIHTRKKFESLCKNSGTPLVIISGGMLETATGCTGVTIARE